MRPLARRLGRALPATPAPAGWWPIVDRNVVLVRNLTAGERARLQAYMQLLLRDKHFEAAQGAVLTEDLRLVIASLAALLILNLDGPCYPRLRTIIVYPGTFVPKLVGMTRPTPGIVVEPRGPELGESWGGLEVVVLAADRVLADAAGRTPGENVVLHEFAHQLDTEDQSADGVPLLEAPLSYQAWRAALQQAFAELRQDVRDGNATVLREYGATNEAEFFAVATEAFFTAPRALAGAYPRLYDILKAYYRQDPERL